MALKKSKITDNIDLKVNIGIALEYEEYTGESFFSIKDETSTLNLLYISFVHSTGNEISFPVFMSALENTEMAQNLCEKVAKQMQKFFGNTLQDTTLKEQTKETEKSEPIFLTNIVARIMVYTSVDTEYLMNKMTMWQLRALVDQIDEKQKSELTYQRLWSYFSILPHINGKKLRTPQDLLPFPWEQEEIRKKAEQELKEKEEVIKKIIGQKLFFQNGQNDTNL